MACAAFLLVGYKDGFVRHGPDELFATLFIVVVWAPNWRVEQRPLRILALAVIGAAFLVVGPLDVAQLKPIDRGANALAQARTLLDPRLRSAVIEDARSGVQDAYAVPPPMLARIGNGTVHVAPYDAAVVWAYPSLHWSPLPVFQTYAAYTAALDALDAARMASPDGPQFVLRRSNAVIDKHLEWWEAPRTILAMACNFEEVLSNRTWQLLERRGDRCSAPRPIGSVTVRPGEIVTVPSAPDPDMIVVARIHGLQADPIERLRTFVASGSIWTMTLASGGIYRLVPGTADGPLIVGSAPGLVYAAPHGPPSVGWFRLAPGPAVGTPSDPAPDIALTIDFEAIRISPWPAP